VKPSSRSLRAGALLVLAGCGGGTSIQSRPEILLYNAKIFTSDYDVPWVQAVLIRGDRVIKVGTTDEMLAAADKGADAIDLRGRVVVPGFNDAHDHLSPELPATIVKTPGGLVPDPPFALVADSLRAAVKRVGRGVRLRVEVGEKVLSDPRARRSGLDEIAPNNPVEIRAWTGHGRILNSAALAAAGVDEAIPDPLGGRFERDRSGRLDGLIEEYAEYGLVPALPDSAARAAIAARAADGAALGITTIQDMTTGIEPATVAKLLGGMDLPVRLRLIRFPVTAARGRLTSPWSALPTARGGPIELSGVKYILDGTPIERGAALRAPYRDRAGWYGRLNFPPDTLRAILREAVAANEQPMIHAVGDSAIGVVLSTLAAVAPDSVWQRLRPRIEHGDGMTPDQFERAKRFGVVVVQNPSHLALGPMAAARYGSARLAKLQPLKSLLANGIMLAFGSDGPQSPFLNIMLAVTHPDNPTEAITVEQAVRAYTLGSAYAERHDVEKGRLAVGMLADLVVLSQDIFTIPPAKIVATTSLLTLKGGKPTHDPERWLAPMEQAGR